MKNIKRLDWDSSFFKMKVGDLFLEEIHEPVLEDKSFDVIYVKQHTDFDFKLEGYQETFRETKVVFKKLISELNINETLTVNEVLDFDDHILSKNDFYNLAYESGKYSRFNLDKGFGESKFKELYRMWVNNSVDKKFAKKIFYTKSDDIITGFVTYQEDNGIGRIGLIATHPDFQGKGLGKKLLKKVELFCLQNNVSTLYIPTQEENTNACKFYSACGYTIDEKMIIKHYWNKNTKI